MLWIAQQREVPSIPRSHWYNGFQENFQHILWCHGCWSTHTLSHNQCRNYISLWYYLLHSYFLEKRLRIYSGFGRPSNLCTLREIKAYNWSELCFWVRGCVNRKPFLTRSWFRTNVMWVLFYNKVNLYHGKRLIDHIDSIKRIEKTQSVYCALFLTCPLGPALLARSCSKDFDEL